MNREDFYNFLTPNTININFIKGNDENDVKRKHNPNLKMKHFAICEFDFYTTWWVFSPYFIYFWN